MTVDFLCSLKHTHLHASTISTFMHCNICMYQKTVTVDNYKFFFFLISRIIMDVLTGSTNIAKVKSPK